MIVKPIIPIILMVIICGILIFLAKTKNKYSYIRRIIIIILLFIVNLRIMIKSSDVTIFNNNLDVLFIIDTTISMVAEDYNNSTRLEEVKNDCKHVIEELGGARYAIITFNNESQIAIPYTTDTNTVSQYLNIIKVMDELYAKGSSLNTPMENMEYLLKSSSEKERKNRIVFFISDGEITNDEKLDSYSKLKKYITDGAVLGYGTKNGGEMKVFDAYSNTEVYIEDRTLDEWPYPKAISKIDEDNLEKIAKDLDIDYIKMEKQSDIDDKLEEIRDKYLINDQENIEESYVDIYYIFVIPILILLIYELMTYKKQGII